jgi:hypothetical protein
VPAADPDRGPHVPLALGGEEPDGLSGLPLPVDVALDRVGLVEPRAHRLHPPAELVFLDLADLHRAERSAFSRATAEE